MKNLTLHKNIQSNITALSNTFIDNYMIEANGEYVKIYIYLLRCLTSGQSDLTLSTIADVFDYTEKDVKRALNYWSKKKLIQLEVNDHKELTDIFFLDLPDQPEIPAAKIVPAAQKETAAALTPETHAKPQALSASRMKKLKEKQEIKQLLFIAEQYLGKTLSPADVNLILYFYDELKFSADLIEYLVEYCVSKGVKSMHYMKTVAHAWADDKITTVSEAKDSTNLYHKNCFSILKAFGIKGRNPAEAELTYINKWMNEYDFTLEILLEACNRTIQKTHQPSFEYADSILSSWKKNGVKHLTDIQTLDENHKAREPHPSAKSNPRLKSVRTNKFNNFESRDYNMDELERELLKQ